MQCKNLFGVAGVYFVAALFLDLLNTFGQRIVKCQHRTLSIFEDEVVVRDGVFNADIFRQAPSCIIDDIDDGFIQAFHQGFSRV